MIELFSRLQSLGFSTPQANLVALIVCIALYGILITRK